MQYVLNIENIQEILKGESKLSIFKNSSYIRDLLYSDLYRTKTIPTPTRIEHSLMVTGVRLVSSGSNESNRCDNKITYIK